MSSKKTTPKKVEQKSSFLSKLSILSPFGNPITRTAYIFVGFAVFGQLCSYIDQLTYEYIRSDYFFKLLPRMYVEPAGQELMRMFNSQAGAMEIEPKTTNRAARSQGIDLFRRKESHLPDSAEAESFSVTGFANVMDPRPLKTSRKRAATMEFWSAREEVKAIKNEVPCQQFSYNGGISMTESLFSDFKPLQFDELELLALHTPLDDYYGWFDSCDSNLSSRTSSPIDFSGVCSDQLSGQITPNVSGDLAITFVQDDKTGNTPQHANIQPKEKAPSSVDSTINPTKTFFRLQHQPQPVQRKSYSSESRYVNPNPVLIGRPECGSKKITSGRVSCSLFCQTTAVKENMLEPASPGGLVQDVDMKSLATPRFILKILENSSGQEFRLKFDITYETEDGATHTEVVISNPFSVRSNVRAKRSADGSSCRVNKYECL
ncbi:hypothetical protein PROFUN_04618 [Planoprotostelium fungivorum]|uniref:Uncharacterized protein n=1 Tax=Planoprotostelium fungivorum TaxID=1890364 RepID=A0A2P6NUF6_9EUKA|nr:hypothetical protein PROFUN_04618 [Planoprotostelium fungivorum]